MDRSPLLQFRDDIFEGDGQWARSPVKATMTFGAFGRALPALGTFFSDDRAKSTLWSDRLGLDVGNAEEVSALLLREALRRNRSNPVLFTTTQPRRLEGAARAVADYDRPSYAHEHDAVVALAAAVRVQMPEIASDD